MMSVFSRRLEIVFKKARNRAVCGQTKGRMGQRLFLMVHQSWCVCFHF